MINISLLVRIFSYILLYLAYLIFMYGHAPLGIDWREWNIQRIFNAVEYLRVNGLINSFGFTVWSKCNNCGFSSDEWIGQIYLSTTGLKFFPYYILNELGGYSMISLWGGVFDKVVIGITGIIISELSIIFAKDVSKLPNYFFGYVSFCLFITAPWTYGIMLSSWAEMYFLLFFLLAMLLFSLSRNRFALFALVLAGFFHYQWALVIAGFYMILNITLWQYKKDLIPRGFLPAFGRNHLGSIYIVFALILWPVIEIVILREFALGVLGRHAGSTLLTRVGISGNDIHNGGLLGAVQFLGGLRITHCFADYSNILLPGKVREATALYNCILSVSGMFMISVTSIAGVIFLVIKSPSARWIAFPLIFSLLVFVNFLQQSMSVHIYGYSYIFSFIFSIGIVGVFIYFSEKIKSVSVSLMVLLPVFIGILLLSIRVSMLINGSS